MPLARQLTVLDIYDVLTDLVPGATVLLFVFILFPVESTELMNSNALLVFTLLLGSLITGHVLQWLRGEVGRQPGEFQRKMDAVRKDGDGGNSIQEDFLHLTNDYFDINSDFDDGERFRLVLSYLETQPPVRALRFQSVYSFHRSLVIASVIGVALSIAALGLHAIQANPTVRNLPYVLLAGGSATLLTFVSRERRDKFEGIFVDYAIREFYIEQIAKGKEGRG